MTMRTIVCLMVAAVLAISPALPALAHKVVASTFVAGDDIEGEVGFSDGAMAADTLVTVTTPDGRPLGETRTDGEGFFTFTPSEAVDHVFRADMGAGHVAEVVMPVADLPKALRGQAGAARAVAAVTPSAGGGMAAAVSPDIRDAIAEAVREEVRPLRREIAAYREKNDLQSILGGIGYIVGLFGIAFYMMARHRLKRAAA